MVTDSSWDKKKQPCFPKLAGGKFFYHLPARIRQICMRIYIFCFKKYTLTNISTSNIIRTNLRFFSFQTTKDRALCFSTKKKAVRVVFMRKLCLKSSIILIFFCGRPGEDFFRHQHFRIEEYYFFLPCIKMWYQFKVV